MANNRAEWFEDWFDDLYLQLYSHRDKKEARMFLNLLQEEYPESLIGNKLDLACGAGRHSFLLKELFNGDVISLDLSRHLLKEASQNLESSDNPMFVEGDIRYLPFKDSCFNLILNMFTSFGYFSDERMLINTLTEINRTLKNDGLFILDLMNKEYTIRNLVEHDEVIRGKYQIKQDRHYSKNTRTVKKKITIYENNHQIREITESVRIFDQDEISKLLDESGFKVKNSFGDYNDTVYNVETSKRMIVISGK